MSSDAAPAPSTWRRAAGVVLALFALALTSLAGLFSFSLAAEYGASPNGSLLVDGAQFLAGAMPLAVVVGALAAAAGHLTAPRTGRASRGFLLAVVAVLATLLVGTGLGELVHPDDRPSEGGSVEP